jgi:hypothetical protein
MQGLAKFGLYVTVFASVPLLVVVFGVWWRACCRSATHAAVLAAAVLLKRMVL